MSQYKTGITFGAFDPLHYGHVELLRRARTKCDKLVVCASNSAYIKKHKGHPERVHIHKRMRILMLLRCVDVVDVQTLEQGKAELIRKHEAEVVFVGDDWKPDTFGGEGLGVPVVYLPHTEGMSSTKLTSEPRVGYLRQYLNESPDWKGKPWTNEDLLRFLRI